MVMIATEAVYIGEGGREVVPDRVTELALSINEVGLLQPIGVVEDEGVSGRYRVVWGRHRVLAVQRLGWGQIEARVISMDAVHLEMAEITENLHRLELNGPDRDRAMLRYAQLYTILHPEVAEQLKAKQRSGMKRGGGTYVPVADTVAATENPPSPAEAVASAFGVAERTARRAIRRARGFTSEEADALRVSGVSSRRQDRILQIEDPSDRTQVVTLIATGLGYDESMREVLGGGWEGDLSGDPSDEEFLASLPIRAQVVKERFDADALFYRKIQKARSEFGRLIGWDQAPPVDGPYYRKVRAFLDALHPREWLRCSNCVSRLGESRPGSRCGVCGGCGYLTH